MKHTLFNRISSLLVAMGIFSALVGCATSDERAYRDATGGKSKIERTDEKLSVYEKFVPPLESDVDAKK